MLLEHSGALSLESDIIRVHRRPSAVTIPTPDIGRKEVQKAHEHEESLRPNFTERAVPHRSTLPLCSLSLMWPSVWFRIHLIRVHLCPSVVKIQPQSLGPKRLRSSGPMRHVSWLQKRREILKGVSRKAKV